MVTRVPRVRTKRKQQLKIPRGFEYLAPFMREFVDHFPHIDRNVFIMMPFSPTQSTERIYSAVHSEVTRCGLVPLRADKRSFSPILWWNVMTYMIGSSYGLVIYHPKGKVPFNPNVSIEAGFMLALDRPVLLLANEMLGRLPVDFSGHIFKTFKPRQLSKTVTAAVGDWIEKDLSYCNYRMRKLIVFASLGGTCRCVMAKAILSQLLHDRKITSVAVEAAAIADPHHATVSPSAVKVLSEIECDKWIEGHRPRKLCQFLQERADLIIILSDTPLARISHQNKKVITDQELFGRAIVNPYPDNEDIKSLERYRRSWKELEKQIHKHFEKILSLADAIPTI